MNEDSFKNLKNISIVKQLSEEEPELYKYVISKSEKVINELDNIKSVFQEYTDHSYKHSLALIRLGDKLLCNNKLSSWEIAIFLLSAFHHDIGMYFDETEYEEIFKSTNFLRMKPYLEDTIISKNQLKVAEPEIINKYIKLEYVRLNHHKRSYNWIINKYNQYDTESFYGNNIYLWLAIAHVCRGHGLNLCELNIPYVSNFAIGSGITIDLLFITILLRLSDICHFSRDRALPYIRNSVNFYSKKSQNIWLTYGEIADTVPDIKSNVIRVYANCTNPNIHRAIIDGAKHINSELQEIHTLLYQQKCEKHFSWKFVDTSNVIEEINANYYFRDFHFNLNYNKITELLMGSRLYSSELFALRECIQNSIDANTIYQLKDKQTNAYIVVCYKNTDSCSIIDIYDNGTGMDEEIVSKHLLSIGSDSFWFSERSYSDWGSIDKSNSIIASHGIGFLSNFLLADKIEVYSKYPEKKEIHLEIDSYKTSVIFRKTIFSEYPNWKNTIPKLEPPWSLGHGTCIRLHLRISFSYTELMEFLSKHFLRVKLPIYFIYENESTELNSIVQFVRPTDDNKNGNSFEKLKKEYFKPKYDSYDNPPMDESLQGKLFRKKYIQGVVYPKYSQNSFEDFDNRLTQNGILINHGDKFLFKSKNMPFNYDIDVSGEYIFDLDAERTSIINSTINSKIQVDIEKILLQEYFRKLSLIESSLYFPCGNLYYHGASSIYVNNSNMNICFHYHLKKFLTSKRIIELSHFCDVNSIFNSKLYILVEKGGATPVSLNDIIKMTGQVIVFIPLNYSKSKGYLDSKNYEYFLKWFYNKISNSVIKLSSFHNLIIIPGFPEAFSLPLTSRYSFSTYKTTHFYKLLTAELDAIIDFITNENVLFECSIPNENQVNSLLNQYKKERKLSEKDIGKLRSILNQSQNSSEDDLDYVDLPYFDSNYLNDI